MSKIAKQKALEVYPIKITRSETETSIGEKYDANCINRQIYIKGYDQALKDFMEKAMDYFKEKPIHHFWVENFRNYMKNESEE